MNIIWNCRACSVKQVTKELCREKYITYTTVATILRRLYDKGLVKRVRKGMLYLYSPKISPELYLKTISRSFLKRLIGSYGDIAIASFAKSIDTLPKEKRQYFIRLLEKHEKRK